MRIIGGLKKGLLIQPPKGLPVRPTTDRAKESLFNILANKLVLEDILVLDLFAGTGNMSFEFASRGAAKVTSIDADFACIEFIKASALKFGLNQIKPRKQDVFAYINQCDSQFDIIFADPPYAISRIPEMIRQILEKPLLKANALLIIEHSTLVDVSHEVGFVESRIYGQSSFSFFERK